MLNSHDASPVQERVIVALDCCSDKALSLADSLSGKARWLKVGMTLFYAEGPSIVSSLKDRGFQVFLDLKLHDIPHQVEGAAYFAALSGADMLSIHASGGAEMMVSALRGVERAACESSRAVPITLGITVLTSMDDNTLADIGVSRSVSSQVSSLATLALSAGLSGVVASPQESAMLREVLGKSACIVTPGVRPLGADVQDQSRIATPAQAFMQGASYIVVGRPITQAACPPAAFEDIVSEITGL